MGCLFYYIITQGHHPFDNPDDSEWWLINRDRNVKNNNVNYSKLEEMGADSQVACSMIKDMVSPNPAYRPSASKGEYIEHLASETPDFYKSGVFRNPNSSFTAFYIC